MRATHHDSDPPGALELYGWQVSYYTGKVRSYLRFKGIAYTERSPDIFDYYVGLRRRTGTVAIPVVRTGAGEWLQDSSHIIDRLEVAFPDRSVLPSTAVQRFAAYLFELWGDELWIPSGLITRWCHLQQNYAFLERDVASDLLPGWPHWVQKRAVAQVARHMMGYLPKAGVIPAQHGVLDRWTALQLDALDRHFAASAFLFGTRPSLGDFGLMGPLYGHLGRDPWPARHLVEPRTHVRAWIERMNRSAPAAGDFLPGDAIPATLEPLLQSLFGEMLPYLEGVLRVAQPALARGGRLPRFMDEVEFPLADGRYRRPAMPYALWMLQRMLDAWRAMPRTDQDAVRAWLTAHGAHRLLDIELPRLRRDGLHAAVVAPDRAAAKHPQPLGAAS
jgi:glutathione S-transferase